MAAIKLDRRMKCVTSEDGQKTWTAAVSGGFDGNGKRRQWPWTCRGDNHKESVQRAFEQWLAERRQSGVTRSRLTLRAYAERWIDSRKPQLALSTWARYQELLSLHVLPGIGGIALQRITGTDLRGLYAKLADTGLSSTTVLHVHRLTHKLLSDALEERALTVNPASFKSGRPKPEHSEMRILGADEVTRLLDSANGTA